MFINLLTFGLTVFLALKESPASLELSRPGNY